MKKNKRITIASAIKQGKWLEIHYKNDAGNTTFWVSIKGIDPERKLLKVDMFNVGYFEQNQPCFISNAAIYFDRVLSARILEETTYDVPQSLIREIERHPERYEWLDFYLINENVLQYYLECYQEDTQIFENDFELIPGVDYDTLVATKQFSLDHEQFSHVLRLIRINLEHKDKTYYKQVKLAMNAFGIFKHDQLFPIVYYPLLLDVEKRSLKIADELRFNAKIKDFQLKEYLDEDLETFFFDFRANKEYYVEMIKNNLNPGEWVDERPYIYQYETNIQVNLVSTFDAIVKMKTENRLTRPLKAFFGNSERINRRRREYSLLLYDEKVNLPQLRVISNAIHQDVTYVQGPPGTGKTTTIINTLLTAFYNDFTVLITSNNNEAIDGIYRKFMGLTYCGERIPFPVLRLGNKEYVRKTIELLAQWYHQWISRRDREKLSRKIDKRLSTLKHRINREMTPVKVAIEQFDEREDINEKVEALNEMIIRLEKKHVNPSNLFRLQIDCETYKEQLKRLEQVNERKVIESLQVPKEQLEEYLYYASLQSLIKFEKNKELVDIIIADTDIEERIHLFHDYISKKFNRLLKIFPFIITTNISAQRLGEPKPHFDLLIMDEAGQCNVALSLIPLIRAERALFVGDPNQLKPIIHLSDEKNNLLKKQYHIPNYYDYKNNSILSTLLKVDQVSLYILLNEHYRCAPDIINFSNQKYYENQLIIRTEPASGSLKFINVEGVPGERKNTSLSEVDTIIQEVQKNPHQSIGIITPFRNQARLITYALRQKGLMQENIKVGTIHTFQGNEKDQIILSLAVTEGTYPGAFNWMKNNRELLNVATTRAKNSLVVIGDERQLKKFSKDEPNDLLELIDYIQTLGQTFVQNRSDYYFTSRVINAKQYNTKAEEEFFQTISHFLTTVPQLKVREKAKMTDVLKINQMDPLFLYANQAHFDFVIYNYQDQPLLAIEVMGLEHYRDEIVQKRDQKKREICQKHRLALFEVKNDYVRRYKMIRDIIIQIIQ